MIKSLLYEDGSTQEHVKVSDLVKKISSNALVWIHLENPNEDEINILRDDFNFHPLAIEDCIHKSQRPKVDKYKDYCFIILNAFKGKNVKRLFTYSELYVFLGRNFLVTFSWGNLKIINEVYCREIENPIAMEKGIDFLLYNLFDAIVDDYFPLTDTIGDKIEAIEEIILKSPNKQIQNDILILKRNMLRLRRILSPQREALNILLRHDFHIIKEETRVYLMDVYDHILRITELIDNYQELLTSTMDLYLSQISNRMNEVMKVLTIITTIMMPLTVITGIYGMNFDFMPELRMKNGYYIVLGIMGVVVLIEIVYFKIKKWI
jgi:magnesium transporter